jgi:uncharacterized SAM-binding protein YcdF (DUF218 family)
MGSAVALRAAHPFLAISRVAGGEFMVVEGWIPEYAVGEAARLFRTGGYQKVLAVGGPVSGAESPAAADDTHAYVAAGRLKRLGVLADRVQSVPTQVRERNRTYASAIAVRKWLKESGESTVRLDVVTLGVHARRSRLLFQKAFGPEVVVGVVAVPNREYDAERWWRYSEGVKEVISETAGYLYVRLFFWDDGEP